MPRFAPFPLLSNLSQSTIIYEICPFSLSLSLSLSLCNENIIKSISISEIDFSEIRYRSREINIYLSANPFALHLLKKNVYIYIPGVYLVLLLGSSRYLILRIPASLDLDPNILPFLRIRSRQ